MKENMMRLKGFLSYDIDHQQSFGTSLIGHPSQFFLGTDRPLPYSFDFTVPEFKTVRKGKYPLVKFNIPIKIIDLIIRRPPSELACLKYVIAGKPQGAVVFEFFLNPQVYKTAGQPVIITIDYR